MSDYIPEGKLDPTTFQSVMDAADVKYCLAKVSSYLCLVLLQVPKCFGLVQIFFSKPKIYLHIVGVTNICARLKDDLHSVNLFFVLAQKV